MMILKPPRLHKGDTIGIVAPASPVKDASSLDKALKYISECGFRVKLGKSTSQQFGYLAGSDAFRAEDIHTMFLDPEIKAVFCLRGGYGSPRLLNLIDYEIIKNNPKIFAGYSDITALSHAIFTKTGLITFSSPMVATDMHEPDDYAMKVFWDMLMYPKEEFHIKNAAHHNLEILKTGTAEGRLFGGNLTVFCALLGSSFVPDMSESILFLEDIGEEPYRIDRLLAHLELSNNLSEIGGLVFGQFAECQPKNSPSFNLNEVLRWYSKKIKNNAPAFQGLSYGHIASKHTMPIGAMAKLAVSDEGVEFKLSEKVVL